MMDPRASAGSFKSFPCLLAFSWYWCPNRPLLFRIVNTIEKRVLCLLFVNEIEHVTSTSHALAQANTPSRPRAYTESRPIYEKQLMCIPKTWTRAPRPERNKRGRKHKVETEKAMRLITNRSLKLKEEKRENKMLH